ncbi:AraC family transcriptional regulator [Reichenbachiella sp. 5M10]|uniref:GyrI-like domain-containing protein n=1 Tax=Reichenbachiella sp. 5M10 TaxID=1889772 RepID=UPI000C152C72|nr:GyrI-like domain-containing protein [Reichenbachiella sp. 5M10]PIB34211.1 AraC family transcriptional regulator [Reichenbachiella sp. 5M10]
MQPRIEQLEEKKLVGVRLKMSMANNRTGQLWGSFMPRRSEIKNSLTKDVVSMQIYDATHFLNFNPQREFEKWATTEVSDFGMIPEGMESFVLPGGAYAVFDYKGSSADHSVFEYIFGRWLPNSRYELDDRPHFEVLGAKYKNNDPDSEEEIWIPIKRV